MMPHLGWLIALLPLACGCPTCDSTLACVLIAGVLAAAIVFVLALSRELWLLRSFREL